MGYDILPNARCGRSGKCYDRNRRIRQLSFEPRKLLVCRTKIMAPFAYTMSFVNCDTIQLALCMNSPETTPEVVSLAELRCDV